MVTISTIIPTYNRTQLLMDRALPSVLAQGDVEVIVVGDGTEAATGRAIRRLGDARVRYWNRRRPKYPADTDARWRVAGLAAVNFGIGQVRGEWLSILADDDEYEANHHADLLRQSSGVDVVYGQSMRYLAGRKAWQTYGEGWPPRVMDICQGAYIVRASVAPTVRPADCDDMAWDGIWWSKLIGTATFRRVPKFVHRFHRSW